MLFFFTSQLSASQISIDATLYAAKVQSRKDDPKRIKSTKNRNTNQHKPKFCECLGAFDSR